MATLKKSSLAGLRLTNAMESARARPRPSSSKSKGKGTATKSNPRQERKRNERHAIDALQLAVDSFNPSTPPALFADLPLSEPTLQGLASAYYSKLTDIQARALPLALQGKDVLGAARTGSGKTLAFLVPVLEILLRKKWGPTDGLGALIISPTRELVRPLPSAFCNQVLLTRVRRVLRPSRSSRSSARLATSTSSRPDSSSAERASRTSRSAYRE